MRRLDLVGTRFGRLVVLRFAGINKNGNSTWLCKCDCGNEKVVSGGNLRAGTVSSCGCIRKEQLQTHGESNTRLYNTWNAMKARCYNPKNNRYAIYGARGITVCHEWLDDFKAFSNWAYLNGYRDDLTIDRIDNDKGYSPDNCRWVTNKAQSNNKRNNNVFTYMGETHTVAEWAEKYGLDYHTLLARLRTSKWSYHDALTSPIRDSERLLELNGEVHNMAEWGRITGFGKEAIRSRLRLGWSVEDALTKPVNKNMGPVRQEALSYKGITGTLKEICKAVGANYHTVQTRMYRGWSLEQAIEMPISDGHHQRKRNSSLLNKG